MLGNDRVVRALLFATQAHGDQKRNDGKEPYICHPIRVMQTVHSVSSNEDMLIAALLHDTIEDTPVTDEQILRTFGPTVLRLVLDLTDVAKPTDGNRAARVAINRAHSARACPAAQTIKLADLIDNTHDIVEHNPSFAKVYLPEKRALLAVLTKGHGKMVLMARRTLEEAEARLAALV